MTTVRTPSVPKRWKALPLVWAVLLCMSILASCGPSESLAESPKHLQTDSLLEQCAQHPDSLLALLNRFESEENLYGIMRTTHELGKLSRAQSRFNESVSYLQRSINDALMLNDTLNMARGYNEIGTSYRRLGLLSNAAIYHYNALDLADEALKQGNRRLTQSRLTALNGIGNVYLALANYAEADSMFRLALKDKAIEGDLVGRAINNANLGEVFKQRSQLDSALTYYNRSLHYNEQAGSTLGIMLCHNSIGEIYKEKGMPRQAIRQFLNAYHGLNNPADRWYWLHTCLSLANIYIDLGKADSARHYLDQAEPFALQTASLRRIANAYDLRYKLNSLEGNTERALHYLVLHNTYQDSLDRRNNKAESRNARLQYERRRHQSDLLLMKQDYESRQREQSLRIVMWASLVVMGILLLFLLKSRHHSRMLRRERDAAEQAQQVAEQAQLKAELAQKEAEQAQQVAEQAQQVAEQAQQEAEQANRLKGIFLQNITHEIRTPLNSILGFNELLHDEAYNFSPEERNEMVEQLRLSVRNLTTLISDTLELSQMDSRTYELHLQTVDAQELCDHALAACQPLCPEGVEMKLLWGETPHEAVKELTTDPRLLQKVLENYLSNACKYTEQGSITLRCRRHGDARTEFSVTDTGCGIDPKNAELAFERFEKLGSYKQGNGLGLSIVQTIARLLKARAYLDTTYPGGARFVFELPAV